MSEDMGTKIIANLEANSKQRNVVYDSDYVSPTIMAACGMGGGNAPLVIEIIPLGKRGKEECQKTKK